MPIAVIALFGIIFLGVAGAMLYHGEVGYQRKALKIFDVLSSKQPQEILTGNTIIKRSGLPQEQIEILWKMEDEGYLKGVHRGTDQPRFERLAMEDRSYEITELGQSFYDDIRKEDSP